MNLSLYIGFNFFIYSFIGWIIEEVYSYITINTFKKDGFLIGPFKPMYGTAMVILVILNEVFGVDRTVLSLFCFLIPTTVEYISGFLLKSIFNKSYWNYSKQNFNINGYVCLKFSLYWMILSFIGVIYLQRVLKRIFYKIKKYYLSYLIFIGLVMMILDIIIRCRNINLFNYKSNKKEAF